MTYELRSIGRDEFPAYNMAAAMSFGHHWTEEDGEGWQELFELDRSLAVFDGVRIVGTGAILSFRLTVPGLDTVPVAGVSAITVLPTHRRRGILTSIMRRQLSDVREREEPLAILWASESIIYGRFGYGMATLRMGGEIDTNHAAFSRSPEISGRVDLIDKDRASLVFPDIYNEARTLRPGGLTRKPGWWKNMLKDPERWRRGASGRFYVVHESDSGEIDGYATYRVKMNWEHGIAAGSLQLGDLVTLNPAARAMLWTYLVNVDLIRTVEAFNLPVDESLRWMLADTRQLRSTSLGDGIWVRLVDIPSALCARRYTLEGHVTIEVVDPFLPDNTGCYELEGGPRGATCHRTDREPDITLQVSDLGAAYLGGVSFTTLAQAGRVHENVLGALRRADIMFSSDVAPFCDTDF
ncbi:MAG: GNAT family N-acetyltransferase [Chloroflexota bacterium]